MIKIGSAAQEYTVHRTLFVRHSEYFRRARQPGRSKERETGVITIDDIEPWVFNAFFSWLYRKQLPDIENWDAEFSSTGVIVSDDWFLVKLYAFGDRFEVPTFRIIVIKLTIALFNDSSMPYYKTIICAFNNLPIHSPMLDVLVDTHCALWHKEGDARVEDLLTLADLPKDFLVRATKRYAAISRRGTPLKLSDYEEKVATD